MKISKNISMLCFSSTSTEKLKTCIEKLQNNHDQKFSPDFFNCFLSIVCGENNNVAQDIRVMKKVKNEIGKDECFFENSSIQTLCCELYLLCFPKHPCKQHFGSILLNQAWNESALSSCLHQCFLFLLDHGSETYLNESQTIQALDHFYQSFSANITAPVLPKGLEYVANTLALHIEDLNNAAVNNLESQERTLHNLRDDLRCASLLIQRRDSLQNENGELSSHFIPALLKEAIRVLQQDRAGSECWNAAGTLVCKLYLSCPLPQCLIQLNEILDWKNLENGTFSYGSYIGLCSGCLSCLSIGLLKQNMEAGKNHFTNGFDHSVFPLSSADIITIVLSTFGYLQTVASRIQTVPDQIALVKCFVQWTVTLRNYLVDSRKGNWDSPGLSLSWLQSYATTNLNHDVDVVRHQARDLIGNILIIGSAVSEDSASFARELVRDALRWDWHKRSIFIFLQCACDFVDIDFLLEQDVDLRDRLLTACQSQSLSPYASQLYLQLAQRYDKRSVGSNGSKTTDRPISASMWLEPALSRLLICDSHQARFLLDYCVAKLLKYYGEPGVECLTSFFQADQRRVLNPLPTIVMCLRAAQRLGLLQKTGASAKAVNGQIVNGGLDRDVIRGALVHCDDQVRLDSFSLLCESWKPTVLVKESDLDLIMYSLPHNITCQCPAFRQHLLASIKKFLHRLSLNLESLNKGRNHNDKQQLITTYTDFKFWLMKFCLENIFPGASHPRKSLSLSILLCVLTTFHSSLKGSDRMLKLFNANQVIRLVGLLKDDYDDNRQLALDILTDVTLKKHVKRTLGTSFLWSLVESSLATGRKSCKPEVCRDVAFNLRLATSLDQSADANVITICRYFVSSLRDDVTVARENLLKAVETGPMHGCLLCLRMLLANADFSDKRNVSAFRKIFSDCVELCCKVASAVLPVVGADSPEGYIPEVASGLELPIVYRKKFETLSKALKGAARLGLQDEASGQRMLVMCWRSAKESYLLLQLLSSIASRHAEDGVLLTWRQLLDIGAHLRHQLMVTVHRGTFEVAYSAFRDYCPLLWRSKNTYLNRQPKQWIQETVADICQPQKARKLCFTRRSAGLPFFVQALLGSNKSPITHDCLRHVMDSLLPLVSCDVIARVKESDDCSQQIHALNIFRGLMRDSSLGEEMLPYLSRCVMASLSGFRSCSWSIRNSSTLLFSALVTRIFGVKKEKDLENSAKNRLSSHEFFTKMPELRTFLLDNLKHHTDDVSLRNGRYVSGIERQCNLYPILLLLSRVYPSPTRQQDATEPLSPLRPLLIRCGHSPIMKCRIMAANALASVTLYEDLPALIERLVESLDWDLPANRTHGTLLQLHRLLRVHLADRTILTRKHQMSLRSLLEMIGEKLNDRTRNLSCLVVYSSLVDVTLEVTSLLLQQSYKVEENSLDVLKKVIACLLDRSFEQVGVHSSLKPGDTLLRESTGKLIALSWLWKLGSAPLSFFRHSYERHVSLSFLRTLKKAFKKKNAISQTDSEMAKDLEDLLIQLLRANPDRQCKSKTFSLLSKFISPTRCVEVLDLTRHLADISTCRDDKLVGAVVSCQAACLKDIIDSEDLTKTLEFDFLNWLPAWVTQMLDACTPVRHDACVRLCVADALRQLYVGLLIDASRRFGAVRTRAWKILFLLLVDEDDAVRRKACLIAHDVATACHVTGPEEPCVDVLSLEVAMDCFVAQNCSNPQDIDDVFVYLLSLSDRDNAEDKPAEGATEPLFDRGSRNTFMETFVLRRLVEKARVQLPTASLT